MVRGLFQSPLGPCKGVGAGQEIERELGKLAGIALLSPVRQTDGLGVGAGQGQARYGAGAGSLARELFRSYVVLVDG